MYIEGYAFGESTEHLAIFKRVHAEMREDIYVTHSENLYGKNVRGGYLCDKAKKLTERELAIYLDGECALPFGGTCEFSVDPKKDVIRFHCEIYID